MSNQTLKEIQTLAGKIKVEFAKYAIKKLEGKKASKIPNMQEDYNKLVNLLCKYFGVERGDNDVSPYRGN